MLIFTVGSNTQTLMTRMCRFRRGPRTFRANHNIINVPVRSYKLQGIDKWFKTPMLGFNVNWLKGPKDG